MRKDTETHPAQCDSPTSIFPGAAAREVAQPGPPGAKRLCRSFRAQAATEPYGGSDGEGRDTMPLVEVKVFEDELTPDQTEQLIQR